MRAFLASILLMAASQCRADDPVLLFPPAASLRLEVTVDGKAPDAAWAAFLDKLFDHFDRDGNGSLSAAEAARVFPLPLLDGNAVKPKDGKATRAEFQSYYRAAGFTPVVVVVRPAPAETLRLADAVFKHLDRDGDGLLSSAELRQAPALLKRLDENEDEVLTAAEILAGSNTAAIPPAGLKLTQTKSDAILKLAIGGRPTLAGKSDAFSLSTDAKLLSVPGGSCVLASAAEDSVAGLKATKGFYLAQFKSIAGEKPAAKSAFEDDATAQVLAGLFDSADRDGDGKLTRAELESFFDLIEAGVSCRIVVTAIDRGRNLFDLIDANGDGRLDLGELHRAAKVLPDELASKKPIGPGGIPASYRLTAGRGTVGESFGPVPLGTVAKPKPAAKEQVKGPRWFLAMDKNGDGFVSAAEFIGPPELFVKLDRNGDGRISPDEAEAAGR